MQSMLSDNGFHHHKKISGFLDLKHGSDIVGLVVLPIENGFESDDLTIISEKDLFAEWRKFVQDFPTAYGSEQGGGNAAEFIRCEAEQANERAQNKLAAKDGVLHRTQKQVSEYEELILSGDEVLISEANGLVKNTIDLVC